MRRCIRCNTEMIENLKIRTNDAMGIWVAEHGIFKGALSKIGAAVCPECGYLETYIEDTEELRSLLEKESD